MKASVAKVVKINQRKYFCIEAVHFERIKTISKSKRLSLLVLTAIEIKFVKPENTIWNKRGVKQKNRLNAWHNGG